MSPDDAPTSDADAERATDADPGSRSAPPRERLGEGAERAIEEFDKRLVDLLAWLLDTETRARIYIYLRQSPWSTSEEIAHGTGLYPSTVREAIVELHEEGVVARRKRESGTAGNNPYEYEAISPSELVRTLAAQVQAELNTVFCLDDYLSGEEEPAEQEAVRIEIESAEG
ncbi:MAG: helix-turn-helix domain-containing protein [Halobacteriales archaeon]